MKDKSLSLILLVVLALSLAACAGGSSTTEAAPAANDEAPAAAPAEPEPTPTSEMSDVPIFEGAENYKSTNNGTYISYVVPDTTVEIVSTFYNEQLAALGWEQKNKGDTGFGGSITMLRVKPDKNISVSIDANNVNNGVRVLITVIPK